MSGFWCFYIVSNILNGMKLILYISFMSEIDINCTKQMINNSLNDTFCSVHYNLESFCHENGENSRL